MNTVLKCLLINVLLFSSISVVHAQSSDDENDVKSTIEKLFDGMRAGDSAMVSSSFTPDAIMQTVARDKEGETTIRNGNLEGFLIAIGTPKDEVWDEQILNYEIKTDGTLATAWTPYEFYIDDQFSHCGVNSFQLAKIKDTWKIFFIVDTRRTTNCDDKN